MAKGNMLQGQATGKVGDIVFMVRNGQQISRVYTSAGGRSGDQASIAVRRQRVRFGAASNQYLLYRNIVRGMYRTGKSTTQSDYNFFVRENVDLLPYLTREENAAGVKCAMPGTFSRGTLGTLNFRITQDVYQSTGIEYQVSGPAIPDVSLTVEGSTVAALKDALKVVFPNARKVTFALCFITKQDLSLPSGSQYTHIFDRQDLIFDLYEADPVSPDTDKIYQYVERHITNSLFIDSFSDDHVSLLTGGALMDYSAVDADTVAMLRNLYVLVFATNDQVGDCYTSTLDAMDVISSDGGLDLYDSLRTDNHRQVAEDSYGYATGVMRTNIQQA